jgi:hypothetical protein
MTRALLLRLSALTVAVALASAALASAALAPTAAAAAAAAPQLTLRLSAPAILTWQSVGFTWTKHDVPADAQVVIQRRAVGTDTHYATVLKVSDPRKHRLHAPMGRWWFRILANRDGSRLAASAPKQLTSYGRIRLATLCQHAQSSTTGCTSGTVQVGDAPYRYPMTVDAPVHPNFSTSLSFGANTCRYILITFAGDQHVQDAGATSWIQVSQDGRVATRSVEAGTIGRRATWLSTDAAHAVPDGEPFSIGAAQDSPTAQSVAIRGAAQCYTPDGKP